MTEIKQGNPATWAYIIQNEGVAVDITGNVVRLIIKKNESDADSAALFNKTQDTHTSPTTGSGSISMTAAESAAMPLGTHYYAYVYEETDGTIIKEYATTRDVEFVRKLKDN